LLEINHKISLADVDDIEAQATDGTKYASGRIAMVRLDLDHIDSHVAHHHRAVWPSHDRRHIKNPYAVEWCVITLGDQSVPTPDTIYTTEGQIAVLTFNRPESRNAMTWAMYDALVDACDAVDANPAVRVLVLRGADDRAFIAGTDINQFRELRTPEHALAYEARLDRVIDRLERVTKPTIAKIGGVAVGGGCVIAMACDLRICGPEARFGMPIARTLGNCLSAANCARLLDLVGPARLKELMFTARLLSAQEALAAGLATKVVDATDLDRVVTETAETIAQNAPLTISATKELVRRLQTHRHLEPGMGDDLVTACYTSEDFRGAVDAFLAKRAPVWVGH
jgi:enoyl-CoA hydratase/carnithine racemase